MAFNIQNIIDSSIASTGQPGNFATSSNSSLIPEQKAPEPSVIPVAEIAKPSAPLPSLTAPPTRSQVATNLPVITSPTAPTETPAAAKPDYGQAIVDLANTDLAGERQTLREEQQIAEKEERARRLGERLIERDNSYRDQIEAAELNPEGKLKGALNDQINDLERDRSRELADLSFSYNIALGDFNAAQSAVDDRIADMEADIARRSKAYETAFTIAQNDLSESEKIQVQQAFQREQAETTAANQKEIARFRYELEAPQRAFENEMAQQRLAASQAQTRIAQRSAYLELALNGDQDAISVLGYDPRDVAASSDQIQSFETQSAEIQDNITRAQELLGNNIGIDTSSGQLRNATIGGFFEGIKRNGLALGTTGGLMGSIDARTEKENFLAGASFIINNQTFDKLVTLKQGGATFGALSDSERVAIGRAASDLAASTITDDLGNITGFKGSEDKLRENLGKVLEGYSAAQDQLNIEFGLNITERDEAAAIWNSNN